MGLYGACLLAAAVTSLAPFTAAPAEDAKPKSPIRFPEIAPAPKPVEPPPPPKPQPISKLTPAKLYVIDADVDLMVFASPAGLVTVVKEAGPLRIRGQFVDGEGYETRDYKGKCVVTVVAAEGKTGDVELIIVPVGAKTEADAVRKKLAVESGEGPRPPPTPEPKPEPDPPTPAPQGFRVIFVYESAETLPTDQFNAMHAKEVRDYLNAKTAQEENWPGWRRWDRDTVAANETPIMKALWEAVKPKITDVPCVVVAVNGKAEIHPFPPNTTEMLAFLKKFGG